MNTKISLLWNTNVFIWQIYCFCMSKAKFFLRYISIPRDAYSILDKFGFQDGQTLMNTVIQKGYAEKREHKIFLTRRGQDKLREIEVLESKPIGEVQELKPVFAPQEFPKEQEDNSVSWILGFVGLIGLILSVSKVVSLKTLMPYGLIGALCFVLLIVSVNLLLRKK